MVLKSSKFGSNKSAMQLWNLNLPESLKLGIVTPIYKGGGKDPLDTNSYRGITLTTVLTKVLESLILNHLRDVLLEEGIPHLNQTTGGKFHVRKPSSRPWKLSRNLPSRVRGCTCASKKPLIQCSTLSSSNTYMKLASMAKAGG